MTDQSVYSVGDTIKTQDIYYEFILVIKDIAEAGTDAESLHAELLNIDLLASAASNVSENWPLPAIGTMMTLQPEEVSLWEEPETEEDTPFTDIQITGSFPSIPGEVYQPHPVRQLLPCTLDVDEILESDPVNQPPHYTSHPSGVECIQITEHMGFNLGNALKYIWRADLKNDAIEDMNKAIYYLKRELEKRNA